MTNIFDLKKEQKAYYKSIVSVFCPLLNETIYFTSDGFIHLLYDSNRKPRNIDEQFMKLKCLLFATLVLQNSEFIADTRTIKVKRKGKEKIIIHHVLVHEVTKGVKIRVVVERVGTGKFKFLSVMPHNKKAKSTMTNKKHP